MDGAPVDAAAVADRLAAAEAEIAKLKDDYLRALAETENLRRRGARERQEAGQYAISSFARDILAVADNLQRALATVDPAVRAQDAALDALMSGIEMTEKELLTVFERYGVKPIAAEGQPFDPHVHEALYEIPNAEVPHGTVLQVMQPGYMIHDRTLRPARVGISRGGPKAGGKPADEPAAADGCRAGGRVPAAARRRSVSSGGGRGEPTGSRVDDTY